MQSEFDELGERGRQLYRIYVLLSMFVGERVGHGASAPHLWTVSMLMGAWIRVGVALFIQT